VVNKAAASSVFRCTLDGSEIERHLEIPAWMFDRAACAGDGHFALDPFVSLEALNALSILLNQLLKTVVPSLNVQYPGACGNSQEKNQGATHDREYEDAADRKASQDGHRCQADGSVRKRGGSRDTKLARSPGRSARVVDRLDDPGWCWITCGRSRCQQRWSEAAMSTDKIGPQHLRRKAILYVRQSSAHQVLHNRESSALQYAMRDRLTALGFTEIEVIDEDLGRSAAGSVQRSGFERMVAEVCLGKVGAVCAREVSRFARNSRDWQQPIEMCRVVDTVLVDQETIYAPRHGNDRLLLGLKGSLNEYDLIFYASARSPHAMKKPVAVNSSYLRRSAS
jgi:hypothetical protein